MKRIVNNNKEPKEKGSKMDNTSEGTPEVDRDVRIDEAHKHLAAMIPLNAKRTYDEMQQESLETIRQCRVQTANIQAIVSQALSNMVENANLAAKQTLDHRDNANILADTATGAVADAMIDQSPPDEGVRQAKTE